MSYNVIDFQKSAVKFSIKKREITWFAEPPYCIQMLQMVSAILLDKERSQRPTLAYIPFPFFSQLFFVCS